jgi:hypothetical protein
MRLVAVKLTIKVIACVDTTLAIRRDEAYIGNAADILACTQLGWVVQEESVKKRNEGCALPTSSCPSCIMSVLMPPYSQYIYLDR